MDGNRRWARALSKPLSFGYRRGADQVREVVKKACDLGVKTLTIFLFSTENWRRTKEEREEFFSLVEQYLEETTKELIEDGVRFFSIGRKDRIPVSLQKTIERVVEATREEKKINLVIALDYGGKDEIVRATKRMIKQIEEQKISFDQIDEDLFSTYMDTAPFGDLDLVIRTSGEMRISNFLLWQSAYAELYFIDSFWPEFTKEHFEKAIKAFKKRKRRHGGNGEKI